MRPGDSVGRYRLKRELGRGGMGTVWLAHDPVLERPVALKFPAGGVAGSEDGRRRLLREARAACALDHPGIATVYDAAEDDGRLYIAMKYVAGKTLADRVAAGPAPVPEVVRHARQAAEALAHAHRQGILHRDVTSRNIMVDGDGNVVMVDFGLARREGAMRITRTGITLGTLAFLAPEVVVGKEGDARSDLYGLGVVLYEVLTGALPFRRDGLEAMIYAVVYTEPEAPSTLRPDIPGALEEVVLRLLAKDPGERYHSAEELAAVLRRLEADPGAAGRRSGAGATAAPGASGGGARPGGGRMRAKRGNPGRGRWLVPVVAVAALAAAFAFLGRGRGHAGSGTTAPSVKPWVLVAEFDAPRGDRSLGPAARHLVMAALDQSEVVSVVPSDNLAAALYLAGKSDTTRVDGPVARELAFRSGIKTVIEGRIDRLGSGYSVVLRALDSDDGRPICAVHGNASDQGKLIACLERLTGELRRGLGEEQEQLTRTRIRWEAFTPSFAAYRKYAEAFDLQQIQGDDRGSIPLLDEALELDPDFAEAWALKGYGYVHLGEPDSQRVCLREALARPGRLTENGRMFLQAIQDVYDGKQDRADAAFQELIRRGYELSSSYGNRGWILSGSGRFREAMECNIKAAHVGPIAPQQWVLGNELGMLLLFGRTREAQEELPKLRGTYAGFWTLGVAVASAQWSRVDSLAAIYRSDPTCDRNNRWWATVSQAANQSAYGGLERADEILREGQAEAAEGGRPYRVQYLAIQRFLLGLATGHPERTPDFPSGPEPACTSVAVGAFEYTVLGDSVRARELVRRYRENPGECDDPEATAPKLIRAAEAGLAGRWIEGAEALAPLARHEFWFQADVGPALVRWMTAQMFRVANQPDSANAYRELALSSHGCDWVYRPEVRMISTVVHLELARDYASLGRVDAAARHLALAKAQATHPDPDLQADIASVEAALQRAHRGRAVTTTD